MGMSTLSPQNDLSQTSENYLNWNVNLNDVEDLDEDQLTSLVRNSYLTHLKKCLAANIEKYGEIEPDKSNINLVNYAKILESKALRRCMLASIYQKVMVQTIADIKTATQNRILYDTFLPETFLNQDKCVQTDDEYFKPNNRNGHEKRDSIDSYEELLSMLMSPTDDYVKLPEPQMIPQVENTVQNNSKRKRSSESDLSVRKLKLDSERPPLDDRLQSLANLFNDSPQIDPPITKNGSEPSECTEVADLSQNFEWETEIIKNERMLNIILKNLDPLKKIVLEKRFIDLFGKENTPIKNPCEKIVARIVVEELTPYYKIKRITSRNIFKHLAKAITLNVLKETFDPGKEQVRKMIEDCFNKVSLFDNLNDIKYIKN